MNIYVPTIFLILKHQNKIAVSVGAQTWVRFQRKQTRNSLILSSDSHIALRSEKRCRQNVNCFYEKNGQFTDLVRTYQVWVTYIQIYCSVQKYVWQCGPYALNWVWFNEEVFTVCNSFWPFHRCQLSRLVSLKVWKCLLSARWLCVWFLLSNISNNCLLDLKYFAKWPK